MNHLPPPLRKRSIRPQVDACVLGTACRTHWQLEQRRVFSAYVESEAWKGELQGPSIRCSARLQTGPIDIWQTTNNTARRPGTDNESRALATGPNLDKHSELLSHRSQSWT